MGLRYRKNDKKRSRGKFGDPLLLIYNIQRLIYLNDENNR